jgi:hypothetical protein
MCDPQHITTLQASTVCYAEYLYFTYLVGKAVLAGTNIRSGLSISGRRFELGIAEVLPTRPNKLGGVCVCGVLI